MHQGCGWKSNPLLLHPSGSDPRADLVSGSGSPPRIFPAPPGRALWQGHAELALLQTWREPSELEGCLALLQGS